MRLLAPQPSIQLTPRLFAAHAAPLLKVEGYAGRHALVAYRPDPVAVHSPRPRARLAAEDPPVDTGEVERVHRADKRLEHEVLDGRARLAELVGAVAMRAVFHRRACPHVGGPRQARAHRGEPLGGFGEHVEAVPR